MHTYVTFLCVCNILVCSQRLYMRPQCPNISTVLSHLAMNETYYRYMNLPLASAAKRIQLWSSKLSTSVGLSNKSSGFHFLFSLFMLPDVYRMSVCARVPRPRGTYWERQAFAGSEPCFESYYARWAVSYELAFWHEPSDASPATLNDVSNKTGVCWVLFSKADSWGPVRHLFLKLEILTFLYTVLLVSWSELVCTLLCGMWYTQTGPRWAWAMRRELLRTMSRVTSWPPDTSPSDGSHTALNKPSNQWRSIFKREIMSWETWPDYANSTWRSKRKGEGGKERNGLETDRWNKDLSKRN